MNEMSLLSAAESVMASLVAAPLSVMAALQSRLAVLDTPSVAGLMALLVTVVLLNRLFRSSLPALARNKGLKQLPPARFGAPVVGPAGAFREDPVGLLFHLRDTVGPAFSLNLIATTFNYFMTPEAHSAFFRVPEDDFSLPQAFIDRCAPLWHPDITPDRNRILMKELSLAFNRSFSLDLFRKAVGPVIADTIKNKYAPQQSIDLFAMTSAIAIRFAVRVVFGKRFYDEHVDDLIKMVKPLEEDIMSPINSFFPGWPLPPNRRMAKFSATMKKWIDREIGLRIDSGFKDDGGNKMDDYLQHLLDSQVYRDFAFAIVPHASMILIAAHTNTAGTIGWTSYHLARDPQLQSEVRAQLDAEKATTTETRVATMPTTTAAMDLFSACIKESGRRYVPVYLLRTVMHDTEFQGYFLRAGENLAIGTACMALDPAVFDSPLKYDPRRWMDGRTDSIVHGREVAMFGAGKHKCLGERLALMTFRQVMFPALLGDYRIELVDGVDAEEALPDYFSTVSTPFSSKPVHVRLVPLAK